METFENMGNTLWHIHIYIYIHMYVLIYMYMCVSIFWWVHHWKIRSYDIISLHMRKRERVINVRQPVVGTSRRW